MLFRSSRGLKGNARELGRLPGLAGRWAVTICRQIEGLLCCLALTSAPRQANGRVNRAGPARPHFFGFCSHRTYHTRASAPGFWVQVFSDSSLEQPSYFKYIINRGNPLDCDGQYLPSQKNKNCWIFLLINTNAIIDLQVSVVLKTEDDGRMSVIRMSKFQIREFLAHVPCRPGL